MKKIAVMLPIGYRGGSLRAAKNISKSIAFQARKHGDDIQVIFSYVKDGKYNLETEFNDLREYGIILRETTWQVYPKEVLQAVINLIDISITHLEFPNYCLPSDGANDFYDCDLWLIISDRLPAPLFPLRRYACIIYDYIQRFVPEIFGDSNEIWDIQVSNWFSLVRNAAQIFVTTPSTHADVISYAGVQASRIHLLELDFEPINPDIIETPALHIPENYFIWTTNASFHKNHINALDALEIYLQELGGTLNIIITGDSSEYFDIENKFDSRDPMLLVPQIDYVRKKLSKNSNLGKRIRALGNLSDKMYAYVLKKAKFLWHPVIYDNGTFSAVEAAYLGIPTLSGRYPAMEYIDQRFELNLRFFNPRNPKDMAETLLKMEKDATTIPLPSREILLERDWKSNSSAFYQAIIELLW
jgi:hypothetical protein